MSNPRLTQVDRSYNYKWDVGTLSWIPDTGSGGGGGGAVTVTSGTITANAGTDLNTSALALEAGGNLETLAFYQASINTPPGVGAVVATAVQGTTDMMPVQVAGSASSLSWASGSISSSGNNTLVTPTGSNKLRIHYVSYNPAAAVELGFRFTVAGTMFLRNNITTGGAIIAKDFGDIKYLQGGPGESLLLNLSTGVTVLWNVFYTEIV